LVFIVAIYRVKKQKTEKMGNRQNHSCCVVRWLVFCN
jgi:hypothetical protein